MAVYLVQENSEDVFESNYRAITRSNEEIEYQGVAMPSAHIKTWFECESTKGIKSKRMLELAKKAHELGIILTPISAKKIAKAEHKSKANSFLEKYGTCGNIKCKESGNDPTEKKLQELFLKEARFRGRTPQILPQIASVCDTYKIPAEKAVSEFSILPVRMLLSSGLSKTESALLYINLDVGQINRICGNLYIAQMVAILLDKGYRKGNESLVNAALWISDHTNTEIKLLEKVFNKADELTLTENTSVDNVRVQFNNSKAVSEVAKVEKAYKKCGFKLKDCVCELRKTTSFTDQYKAEILEGDDPRQVMLGYETDCCQHLGEAGESAMMHGLLHPKAGFWVVTKRNSGKVVAQAESWELNSNTLVFDNIEFANDAEIDQYKEVIGKWVEESPYENIIMGCGYNEFANDEFENAGRMIPPVTAYELYVLSYESDCEAREEICELESAEQAQELMDNGIITYFDYVYCDSENVSVYLKKNGRISKFFEVCEEQQLSSFDNEEEYEEVEF